MMKTKLGLLAVPVVAGLGVLAYMSVTPAAHATPAPSTLTNQQAPADKEMADVNEKQDAKDTADVNETNKTDTAGPNVEQTGQNETAN